ncbi:MAG: ogt [Lachnospiraceae bacterium]|jgi:methylated-DNA-[protein]-cysteine S-methyltransferase|nr:ogt [Lachnospiraceae bacterium]
MKNTYYYETQIGKIAISEDGSGITNIDLITEKPINLEDLRETSLIKKAAGQLQEYFDGKRKVFELPLNPSGTEFQNKVWEALKTIPYGERWSYKQVAESIGKPNAARAVGMANNKNPIMIVIPCHRVVGAKGDLVGYAGGLHIKEMLLKLEER